MSSSDTLNSSMDTSPQNVTQRILHAFDSTYVPVAVTGLPKMLVDGGETFCFRAFAGEGDDELRLEGIDERYAAMSMIGVLRQKALGIEVPFDHRRVIDHLYAKADELGLDDAGLVLWVLILAEDERASALQQRIVGRRDEAFTDVFVGSMEMACLMLGLTAAIDAGIGTDGARGLLSDVASRLRENQDPETGLFSFLRRVRRKNFVRARADSRLGSFASQVYPTMAFSAMARSTGDERALSAALSCANRIQELQGEQGQWWWVYNKVAGVPAVRFPVYTVHQDAMGPMMMAAAALADGGTSRFDSAIELSLRWLDERPELPDAQLTDRARGVVWRAVQHDDPAITGRLGLGTGELKRMARSAWIGGADERPLDGGFVCPECRPYHLGWILLADAMYREVLATR